MIFGLDTKKEYEAKHCQCGESDEYPHINAYCNKWFSNLPEFCLLNKGSLSRPCPDSRQIIGKELYFTSDEKTCNASKRTYQREYLSSIYRI